MAVLPIFEWIFSSKRLFLVLYVLTFWTRVRTRTRNSWTRKYPDPGLTLNRVFGRSTRNPIMYRNKGLVVAYQNIV